MDDEKKEVFSCSHCDEPVDDEGLCDECEENTSVCYRCDSRIDNDEMHEGSDGEYYCETCFNRVFTTCHDCDCVVSISDIYTTINGEMICDECYNDNYFTCDDCGEVMHIDNYGSDGYCDDCYSEGDDDDECHSDVELTKYCNINADYSGLKQLPVSVEVEAEGGNYSDVRDKIKSLGLGCGVTRDGSLDHTGLEVQTTPAKITKFKDIIKRVCKTLSENDYTATAPCGLHTHIGLNGSTDKQILQIIKTFTCFESVFYTVLPVSRSRTNYCKMLPSTLSYPEIKNSRELNKLMRLFYACGDKSYAERLPKTNEQIKQEYKGKKYHNSRYHGFNLHSFILRNTIELRYHSGTLNHNKIVSWVQFMLNITNWARMNYTKKCLDYIYSIDDKYNKLKAVLELVGTNERDIVYFLGRYRHFNTEHEAEEKRKKEALEAERLENERLEGIRSRVEVFMQRVEGAVSIYRITWVNYWSINDENGNILLTVNDDCEIIERRDNVIVRDEV